MPIKTEWSPPGTPLAEPLPWRSPTRPYPHQFDFKAWRRGWSVPSSVAPGYHPACLLEVGLGGGKTLSGLEEVLELIHHQPRAQILVLARNSNLETVWGEQLPQHAPGVPFTILNMNRVRRREILMADKAETARIWVHSHEDLPAFGPELAKYSWDMIIIDECARFRTASAARTRLLTGRADKPIPLDAPLKVAMSGMPMIKNVTDLYPVLRWLGVWNGNKEHFVQSFLVRDENGKEIAVKDAAGLERILRACRFQVPENAILNLPRTWRYDRVQLAPRQRESYRRIQRDLKTRWVDPETGRVEIRNVGSRLTELMRLAQVTAGFEAIDVDRWNWRDDNAKTKHLLQVVMPELDGEKVILWCVFRPEVENLTRLLIASGRRAVPFYGSGPERDEANLLSYQLWKTGRADVFVSTLAKGAHGLNLPEASTMVFHSRDFNTENFVQALGRNKRLTTKHEHLKVIVIEAEGTVDQKVTKVLGDDIHKAAQLTSVDLKELVGAKA